MKTLDYATPSSRPQLLLGVDGGGSTTQAVVADLDGRILGRGLGPGCNHHKVGLDFATRALAIAIGGALDQVVGPRAGEGRPWSRADIPAACFGLAGIDSQADSDLIARWVREQGITADPVVVNDSELVLSGGTPHGWGVGLISGTGSICLGRTAEGRSVRVGGWGHVFGDEGSGYHIATEALRLASQTADGRAEATGLLKGILGYWRLAAPEDLIRYIYRPETTVAEISQLAIGIQELATRGNPDAVAIVDRAAKALAVQVDTAVRKLRLKQPPLALGGAAMRASLKKGLLAHLEVEIGPVALVLDPVLAAVTMAQRRVQPAARVG
jgi:N-acetylglucosamine kinase-like BadF-type ATPase